MDLSSPNPSGASESDERPVRQQVGRDRGRPSQRRRTRKAIIDAAVELVAAGQTPSVDEIARAAEVSRRTIYLHFPTLEQLLIDATAGALSNAAIDAALDQEADSADPAARVEALAGRMLELSTAALPLGRQLIRLTVAAPPTADTGLPKRGYRRIEWIERALEPLRRTLDDEQFERLVSSLALVIGWEAMIVLRDVRGLDADAEARTVTWAARALVDAMLAEAGERA
jgi:AcrR family transcriptional regulator